MCLTTAKQGQLQPLTKTTAGFKNNVRYKLHKCYRNSLQRKQNKPNTVKCTKQ